MERGEYIVIYENIVEIAKNQKLSICALEKKAGLGDGTIGGWRKSSPNVDSLSKVADALNVSITKLLRK